jgi:hypothetical protein
MVWSINLLVLAVGLLIVGMIKPHWILFWMEKPKRIAIILVKQLNRRKMEVQRRLKSQPQTKLI